MWDLWSHLAHCSDRGHFVLNITVLLRGAREAVSVAVLLRKCALGPLNKFVFSMTTVTYNRGGHWS